MEQNLLYYKSRKDASLGEHINTIQKIRHNMNDVSSVGELMGLEGTGRVEYYSAFDKFQIKQDYTLMSYQN